MRTIERKVYVAFDSKEFDTAGECKAYERDQAPAMLVGLTAERIAAALDRSDPDLAEAIERVGTILANARREAGDLKRRRRAEESGAPSGGQDAAEDAADQQGSEVPDAPSSDPTTDDEAGDASEADLIAGAGE